MSFLTNYLEFTKGQESTERVHRWVAISTIAAAMERKVWINRGSYTLYPNLYTFIVGPSGVVRKSTSTAIGVGLLREIDTVKVMSERVTSASLIQQFERSGKNFPFDGRDVKQSSVFAYASELNVFLGEVFGSISELLTTFYDCVPNDSRKPWTYETIGRGIVNIYGPCLNLLGASTPRWLVRSIPPSELEGGFASRVIFVVEDSARRSIAWPELECKPEDYEAQKRFLVSDLKRIHSLVGPMQPADDLRTQGQLWYESHQKAQKTNTDLRFSGYYGRKFDTVLKVATALSVSESSDLILTLKHFEESLAFLTDIESRMFDAFGGHGENPDNALIDQIWTLLKRTPNLYMSTIMSVFRREGSSTRLSGIMEHMVMMNRVQKFIDRNRADVFFQAIDPERPL